MNTIKKDVPSTVARLADATIAAISAAQWLQPIAAIRIGSGARETSSSESAEPDATEANSKAVAAPALTPIRAARPARGPRRRGAADYRATEWSSCPWRSVE